MRSQIEVSLFFLAKAAGGGAVFLVVGDMQSMGDGGQATDTHRPQHACGQC